ncbi:MAG: hypothetical protein NZ853_02835 [Leptospiraceae bacterium]|nr:hypothetical protein [Leptospiraceae bacterium]MDW7975110.1 hypothetical protein [Leptospiraceae bacterium]
MSDETKRKEPQDHSAGTKRVDTKTSDSTIRVASHDSTLYDGQTITLNSQDYTFLQLFL